MCDGPSDDCKTFINEKDCSEKKCYWFPDVCIFDSEKVCFPRDEKTCTKDDKCNWLVKGCYGEDKTCEKLDNSKDCLSNEKCDWLPNTGCF
jgi:hypothetical protein